MGQLELVFHPPHRRAGQPQFPGAGSGAISELRRAADDAGLQAYAGQPSLVITQPEADLGTGAPRSHRRFHDRTLTGGAGPAQIYDL
jgi:hypothetical protein